MKRIIVDYAKLTHEILNLLVDKFPDGYDDSNIIRFRNHKDEAIEAVEVKTDDTIYLVKISTKLSERMFNYDEDDEIDEVPEIDAKVLDLNDDDAHRPAGSGALASDVSRWHAGHASAL